MFVHLVQRLLVDVLGLVHFDDVSRLQVVIAHCVGRVPKRLRAPVKTTVWSPRRRFRSEEVAETSVQSKIPVGPGKQNSTGWRTVNGIRCTGKSLQRVGGRTKKKNKKFTVYKAMELKQQRDDVQLFRCAQLPSNCQLFIMFDNR